MDSELLAGREGGFSTLDWWSHRLQRVCRSSYAAELYGFEEGLGAEEGKVLAKATVVRHEVEQFDYDRVARCLAGEAAAQRRHLEKLKSRNGVVAGRIRGRLAEMRLERSASDESGPVDLE